MSRGEDKTKREDKEARKEELQRVSFNTTIHKTKKVNKGDNHDESHDGTAFKERFSSILFAI